MPSLTVTTTRSMVITARSTGRFILPTTCGRYDGSCGNQFLCSNPAGWRTHLDRHQRFIQSEIGEKSNRWARQAHRERVDETKPSVRVPDTVSRNHPPNLNDCLRIRSRALEPRNWAHPGCTSRVRPYSSAILSRPRKYSSHQLSQTEIDGDNPLFATVI
jgi:hypothetical protein